jgi:hypothetical protein
MESAQTGQDTTSDPAGESAPDVLPGAEIRTRGRIEGHELVEPVVEAVEERGAAGDNDVGEEVWADVGVDLIEGGLMSVGSVWFCGGAGCRSPRRKLA